MKTHETHQALTAPLFMDAVGPDGLKRSIHAFPKVLGSKEAPFVGGLEAFRLHLPSFLERRRGEESSDPESGSSFHLLFDTEDASHVAEIVRRVVREELPRRFGKYLDVLHSFEVTVHRETRNLIVSLDLTPHGVDRVTWSFELHFPREDAQRHPSSLLSPVSREMSDPRTAEWVRIARHFYPAGLPSWDDDDEETVPAYQRTPEHQRWMAAWEQTVRGRRWTPLMDELRSTLPEHQWGIHTPAYHSACWYGCLYLKQPLPDGQQRITRVVGAVSVIAPVYLIYTTTLSRRSGETSSGSQPSFETDPNRWTRSHEDSLARHIERVLGYLPFPLESAEVPLPGLRVDHAHGPPTLLSALFASREGLLNLP